MVKHSLILLVLLLLSNAAYAWVHSMVPAQGPHKRDYHRWTSDVQSDTGISAILECSRATGTEFFYEPEGERYQVPVEGDIKTFDSIVIGSRVFKAADLDFWGSSKNRRNIERFVRALNESEIIMLYTSDGKNYQVNDITVDKIDSDVCTIGFPANVDSKTRATIR